ncbi:DELLA protein RGL1-like protein [Tanacetum coccineum]
MNANGTIWGGVMLPTDVTSEEKIGAFNLLHQNTPYIAFGFMLANDAIVQACRKKDRLHIIDFGMEHTLEWPSFIRTLASTSNQEIMAAEANSLGIRLEFRLIAGLANPEMLAKDNLHLKKACMGRKSMERLKIERNHFAKEIRNIVAYEGPERVKRHERADQWRLSNFFASEDTLQIC